MTDDGWSSPDVRCIGMQLHGDAIDEADARGHRVVGDTLIVMLNADSSTTPFVLPAIRRRNAGKRCSTPPIRGARHSG